MAALKIRNFNYLFPRYCRYLCFRRNQSFKCSSNLILFRIQHEDICFPIFQVISPIKSYFPVVSYSCKVTGGKPLNLESAVDYEKVSEETLQSLYDRFEEVLENSSYEDWDVNYSNGVLTVTIEANYVYVINKQTPNRQIWLSSPKSGPKRYDYVNGTWIYKHDGVILHKLLSNELTELLQKEADFFTCTYSN